MMKYEENTQRYQKALALFEQERYGEFVEASIALYEENYEKEMLLQNLYNCFVLPNQDEFRSCYEKNREGISDIDFQELPIDFIPVSDTIFYLFHRERQQFLGKIDLTVIESGEQSREVYSLLITDNWDLREMIPHILETGWNTVYILVEECQKEFLSFLKLPGIGEKLLQNAVVFFDADLMEQFFRTYPEYYLPKIIVSQNTEAYLQMMRELHQERLENADVYRKNILLSICIPSCNRGHTALKNVQNLRWLEYDSEIEIIVSNNGSKQKVEEYEQICQLLDSRIKYFAFEENQGFANNVCKVLELAEGRFAVLVSDEDFMLLDKFHDYLNCLLNHENAGVITATGFGKNYYATKDTCYDADGMQVFFAMTRNYMTGITLNTRLLCGNHVLERVRANWENEYVQVYTHGAIASLLTEISPAFESEIQLWYCYLEPEYQGAYGYMHYGQRVAQQDAQIEWIKDVLCVPNREKCILVVSVMQNTFRLLSLIYKKQRSEGAQLADWQSMCDKLYMYDMEMLEQLGQMVQEEEFSRGKYFLECEYLSRRQMFDSEDLSKQNIL